MTALSESLSLMIICDIFSLSILTYLLFSWIGKPIIDSGMESGVGREVTIMKPRGQVVVKGDGMWLVVK